MSELIITAYVIGLTAYVCVSEFRKKRVKDLSGLTNLDIQKQISDLELELYRRSEEYSFNKLLIEGWFYGEYTKFKTKTEQVIVAEYLGQSSMDAKNYKLSIVSAEEFKQGRLQEISLFTFNRVIENLYHKREHTNDFKSFIAELILNGHRTI